LVACRVADPACGRGRPVDAPFGEVGQRVGLAEQAVVVQLDSRRQARELGRTVARRVGGAGDRSSAPARLMPRRRGPTGQPRAGVAEAEPFGQRDEGDRVAAGTAAVAAPASRRRV
jgi:hypothetical protein